MVTSSEAAAARSRRLHTVKNVEQNMKAAKQRALEQQRRIEKLAKPLNSVSEKLAKLERAQDALVTAKARKIESLQSGLEKRIEKLKADTAAKVARTESDTAAEIEQLHLSQRESEDALLLEYAQAIVQFSFGGSNTDLATVLGVSQKEARELIATSTAELESAGITVARTDEVSTSSEAVAQADPEPAVDPASVTDSAPPATVPPTLAAV